MAECDRWDNGECFPIRKAGNLRIRVLLAFGRRRGTFVYLYCCSIIFGFLLSSPETELQCLSALQDTIIK